MNAERARIRSRPEIKESSLTHSPYSSCKEYLFINEAESKLDQSCGMGKGAPASHHARFH